MFKTLSTVPHKGAALSVSDLERHKHVAFSRTKASFAAVTTTLVLDVLRIMMEYVGSCYVLTIETYFRWRIFSGKKSKKAGGDKKDEIKIYANQVEETVDKCLESAQPISSVRERACESSVSHSR